MIAGRLPFGLGVTIGPLSAPHDGTVAELLYAPGDQVNEGAELLKLAVA